ncbi:hypothetical protein AB0M79_23040 [Polymorphospora sp. NPDC051019]|uniref:hypothetical protein n=1 Tax=Polymorphospora sp. NPDC051019 TaxID=3155725 RepID=UPI0034337ECB
MAVILVTVTALVLGNAVKASAAVDYDEETARQHLFAAHMRMHSRGADGIRAMVVSASLTDWRAAHPNATREEIIEAGVMLNNAVLARYQSVKNTSPYSLVVNGVEAISALPFVNLAAPGAKLLLKELWGNDVLAREAFRNQVTGAYQNYVFTNSYYGVQDRVWALVAAAGVDDPTFADAWDGLVGTHVGVRLNASLDQLMADPLLRTYVNVDALMANTQNQTTYLAQARRMAEEAFGRIQAKEEEIRAELARQSLKYPVGPGPKPTPEAYTRALAEAAQRDVVLAGLASGLSVLTTFIGFADPKAAREIQAVGSAAITIAKSISDYIPKIAGLGVAEALTSIGTVVMTGNILGAVMTLTSIFMGSGPSPEQMILEEIAKVREDIENLRTEMHQRFDAIEKALSTVYADMMTQFTRLQGAIDDVRRELGDIQSQLLSLDTRLVALSASTHAALEAQAMHDFELAAERYLDYQGRTGQPVPNFTEYWQGASTFSLTAKTTAASAPLAITDGMAPSVTPDAVRQHTPLGSLYYLAWLARSRGWDPDLPMPSVSSGRGVPNAGVWSVSAHAWTQLAAENPQFARSVSGSVWDEIVSVGTKVNQTAATFSAPQNGTTNKLFTNLMNDYESKLGAVSKELEGVRDEVALDGAYNPFIDASQPPPARVPEVETMAPCSTTVGGPGNTLAIAANTTTKHLPHAYHTAYVLRAEGQRPEFRTCYEAVYSNQETTDGRVETVTTADITITAKIQVKWPQGSWTDARKLTYTTHADRIKWVNHKTGYQRTIDTNEKVGQLWSAHREQFADRASIGNVAVAENDAWMRAMGSLHARQKVYYATVLQRMDDPTSPLRKALDRLDETLMLLQAYTQVGWSKALEHNESLRALLFGGDHLPGRFTLAGTGYSDHFREAFTGALTAYGHCTLDAAGGCPVGTWYDPRGGAPGAFGKTCGRPTYDTTLADPVTHCVRLAGAARVSALRGEYAAESARLASGAYQEGLTAVSDFVTHMRLVQKASQQS